MNQKGGEERGATMGLVMGGGGRRVKGSKTRFGNDNEFGRARAEAIEGNDEKVRVRGSDEGVRVRRSDEG
jgi:hypothetical protein